GGWFFEEPGDLIAGEAFITVYDSRLKLHCHK
ncbi:unnamed protein product, partial [marine sediment metagenome]